MIVRFLGDPTGYTLCRPLSQVPHEGDPGPQWTEAYVGSRGLALMPEGSRKVWIDVSKAYLIEEKA